MAWGGETEQAEEIRQETWRQKTWQDEALQILEKAVCYALIINLTI